MDAAGGPPARAGAGAGADLGSPAPAPSPRTLRVPPMAMLPMLLSLVAILFALSASQQVNAVATRDGGRDVARALRQRLVALSRGGREAVTLDLATIDKLFQLVDVGGGDTLAPGGDGDDSGAAAAYDADGNNASGSAAADAADPPGLILERDGDIDWAGVDEDDDGGAADEAPQPAAKRPAPPKPPKPPKPAAAASKRATRGLTRQELVMRQLLRAEALVPRNRPDEPPRRRPAAAGAPRRRCDPEERFLHLLTAREGMSAWLHTLQEAIAAANALGRTFVEPCVAGGLLLPCTPGRVLPVPASAAESDYPISATDDPLAVPAFVEHCGPPPPDVGGGGGGADGSLPHDYGVRSNITPADGRSYPLSLYLDAASVKRLARSWVSFDDWAYCSFIDEATGRDELTDLRRARGLVHAQLTYCVSAGDGPFALAGKREPSCVAAVGPYRFKRVWYPADLLALRKAGNTTREHMATGYLPLLRADASRDMFLTNAWRGFWRRYGSFSAKSAPGFNPIHVQAVRAWLAYRLDVGGALDVTTGRARAALATGGGKGSKPAGKKVVAAAAAAASAAAAAKLWPLGSYALFQWRSETVDKDLVEPCAQTLAGKVKASLAALRRLTRVGGVLAADLPASNNPCAQWHVYEGSASENGARRRALGALGSAGLAKYDADHPGVDAGVLSIRCVRAVLRGCRVAFMRWPDVLSHLARPPSTPPRSDWLLAVHARWYVTCHSRDPADCDMCFRSNSKYVGRILDYRAALGKRSFTNWFQLRPVDLLGSEKIVMSAAPR